MVPEKRPIKKTFMKRQLTLYFIITLHSQYALSEQHASLSRPNASNELSL